MFCIFVLFPHILCNVWVLPHKDQPSEWGSSWHKGALQGSVSQDRSKVQLLFQGIFASLELGIEIEILGNADQNVKGSQELLTIFCLVK